MLPGSLLFLRPVPPALRLLHHLSGWVVRGRLGVVFFGVRLDVSSEWDLSLAVIEYGQLCHQSQQYTRAGPATRAIVLLRLDSCRQHGFTV